MADERRRVLAIDGGGIRGIIPALVLAELERLAGRPVHTLFDLVAGTSTGGLLALALTRPREGGRPPMPAAELAEIYERDGPEIFSRSLLRRIRTADGVLDERYSDTGLEASLHRRLGDTPLSAALTDVLVTAYDTDARTTWVFKSAQARERPARDVPMRVAGRATAAAPTYFEPLSVRIEGRDMSLVDGGVWASNPAMSAFAEVQRARPGAEVVLLSLGTGELTRRLPYRTVKDWGRLAWARPIIDVVLDGQSDGVHYQLEHLLGTRRYVRVQTELTEAGDDLDDASERNLRDLRRQGRDLAARSAGRLEELLAQLGA